MFEESSQICRVKILQHDVLQPITGRICVQQSQIHVDVHCVLIILAQDKSRILRDQRSWVFLSIPGIQDNIQQISIPTYLHISTFIIQINCSLSTIVLNYSIYFQRWNSSGCNPSGRMTSPSGFRHRVRPQTRIRAERGSCTSDVRSPNRQQSDTPITSDMN